MLAAAWPVPAVAEQAREKVVFIVRGISGSGKSTLAARLGQGGKVLSSDDFFMVKGRYAWDATQLGRAHRWNERRAALAMRKGVSPIVVDSTNLAAWEPQAYVRLALKHGYRVELREPDTPWRHDADELASRNRHGVPRQAIVDMLARYVPDLTVAKVLAAMRPKRPIRLESGVIMRHVSKIPVERILGRLNAERRRDGSAPLHGRGEAHITVLRPVEVETLSRFMPVARLEELATEARLDQLPFRVRGLGRARATIDVNGTKTPAETVFLVVESKAIQAFRRLVHAELVARGGDPAAFRPEEHEPHITVGFTHRDLFERDGAVKDASAIDPRYRGLLGKVGYRVGKD